MNSQTLTAMPENPVKSRLCGAFKILTDITENLNKLGFIPQEETPEERKASIATLNRNINQAIDLFHNTANMLAETQKFHEQCDQTGKKTLTDISEQASILLEQLGLSIISKIILIIDTVTHDSDNLYNTTSIGRKHDFIITKNKSRILLSQLQKLSNIIDILNPSFYDRLQKLLNQIFYAKEKMAAALNGFAAEYFFECSRPNYGNNQPLQFINAQLEFCYSSSYLSEESEELLSSEVTVSEETFNNVFYLSDLAQQFCPEESIELYTDILTDFINYHIKNLEQNPECEKSLHAIRTIQFPNKYTSKEICDSLKKLADAYTICDDYVRALNITKKIIILCPDENQEFLEENFKVIFNILPSEKNHMEIYNFAMHALKYYPTKFTSAALSRQIAYHGTLYFNLNKFDEAQNLLTEAIRVCPEKNVTFRTIYYKNKILCHHAKLNNNLSDNNTFQAILHENYPHGFISATVCNSLSALADRYKKIDLKKVVQLLMKALCCCPEKEKENLQNHINTYQRKIARNRKVLQTLFAYSETLPQKQDKNTETDAIRLPNQPAHN